MINVRSIKEAYIFLSLFFLWAGPCTGSTDSATLLGRSGVAAVVNAQAVTHTDRDQRLRLLKALMSGQSTDHLVDSVMNALIEETLKLEWAAKIGINISDEELEKGVERFIQMVQPNADKDQFMRMLSQNQIGLETVTRQVKAQLVWQKGIQAYHHTQSMVTEREIDQEIAYIKKGLQGVQYDIMEIVLPVDTPQQEPKVLAQAKALINQLERGERFELLAQQFSRSPTALKGGHKGWVSEDLLDPAWRASVVSMTPGSLSQPIRMKDAVCIVMLRGRKEGGRTEHISFRQGMLNIASGSETEILTSQLEIKEALADVHTCKAFEGALTRLPGGSVGGADRIDASTLPSALQGLLSKAKVNVPTSPIEVDGGLMVFMVCDRHLQEEALPSRDEVAHKLYVDKINRLASRTMRDIRQSAWIEIKK